MDYFRNFKWKVVFQRLRCFFCIKRELRQQRSLWQCSEIERKTEFTWDTHRYTTKKHSVFILLLQAGTHPWLQFVTILATRTVLIHKVAVAMNCCYNNLPNLSVCQSYTICPPDSHWIMSYSNIIIRLSSCGISWHILSKWLVFFFDVGSGGLCLLRRFASFHFSLLHLFCKAWDLNRLCIIPLFSLSAETGWQDADSWHDVVGQRAGVCYHQWWTIERQSREQKPATTAIAIILHANGSSTWSID